MIKLCRNCEQFYVDDQFACMNCGISFNTQALASADEIENKLVIADRIALFQTVSDKALVVCTYTGPSAVVFFGIWAVYSQNPAMNLFTLFCFYWAISCFVICAGSFLTKVFANRRIGKLEFEEGRLRAASLRGRTGDEMNSLLGVEREIERRLNTNRERGAEIDRLRFDTNFAAHQSKLERAREMLDTENSDLRMRQQNIYFLRWQNSVIGWTQTLPNPVNAELTIKLLKKAADLKQQSKSFLLDDDDPRLQNALNLLNQITLKLQDRQVALTLNRLEPAALKNINENVWMEETAVMLELQAESFDAEHLFPVEDSAEFADWRLEFLQQLELESGNAPSRKS